MCSHVLKLWEYSVTSNIEYNMHTCTRKPISECRMSYCNREHNQQAWTPPWHLSLRASRSRSQVWRRRVAMVTIDFLLFQTSIAFYAKMRFYKNVAQDLSFLLSLITCLYDKNCGLRKLRRFKMCAFFPFFSRFSELWSNLENPIVVEESFWVYMKENRLLKEKISSGL